jgi:hypothetical protein
VYGWLWRRLPGGRPGKLLAAFGLLVAVLALLFFVVFPWVEPRLPFNEVTVDTPSATATPSGVPSPSASPTALPS